VITEAADLIERVSLLLAPYGADEVALAVG
jgi:hypothetical protein